MWEPRDQPLPGSFPKKDPGYEVGLFLNNRFVHFASEIDTEIEDIKLDIVILQNRADISNAKNTKSTEEISELRLQLQKEQHKNRMLEDRARAVEEERDSLRLALKLLMQDQVSKPLANDLSTQGNCWQPVDKTVKSGKTTMSNKTGKTAISNNDVNGDKSSSLWYHANSFGVLGELHTSCGETEERQPEIISTSKAKHDERKSRTAKKRGTVIVG